MTAADLREQIAALRDSMIPVQVRDQYGGTLEVAGVETDLDNTGAEVALVIGVRDPAAEQAAEMRSDLERCRAYIARFLIPWRSHLPESWLSGFEEEGCVVFDEVGFVKAKPITSDTGKGFVRIEDVKPLFKAVAYAMDWCCDENADEIDGDRIREAWLLGKRLGLEDK